MSDFRRVLIAGTGPSAVQLAVMLKSHFHCELGIAGRQSSRSELFFSSVRQSGLLLRADVQNAKHGLLAGACVADDLYEGYESVSGRWSTLILSVTTDAYLDVLGQLDNEVVRSLACVVLVSPTFGSGMLVSGYLRSIQAGAEVISCSTYIGDTRWREKEPSGHVVTAGMKKKIFVGSDRQSSGNAVMLAGAIASFGIEASITGATLEAETRNISLYVHPPLFMNDFSLKAVFDEPASKKYVYKLYPEGPITQQLIRELLAHWKEITAVLKALNIKGVNLLKFMTDDNYPVRPESLSRRDIENFEQLDSIHQEYLLYIRYASLLIDPYSEPDEQGRYYDFSAVPFKPLFMNREGCLDIPRMPKEDYYRLKIIQGIARRTGTDCPTIDRFLGRYENKIAEVANKRKGEPLSPAFAVQHFEEPLSIIFRGIEQLLPKRFCSTSFHKT
ncbi:opine metallophore biosynthesis dehydrogenase [Paenibacillus soyae]|uniref:Opine metallophore biosynthesis dehydrogenase n=1 Tax=Paenibacillus soyae TaxID=2969249 RepID=A0A9X2SB30_9BACL|nr:opine metallophore biosynthesis dehydrogenase [Paenibacillus soyae]MCR2806585.1 opine metallophore biosynthesis dehydrogenase [Paenibacillus soyae]